MNWTFETCEQCGGTGIDVGGLSAYERTDCETCGGTGKEVVDVRNYLGEAFRIASGTTLMQPERAHLVAVVEHCRALATAALALPIIAERVAA